MPLITRRLLAVVTLLLLAVDTAAASRPNLLIITVDDMGADAVGAFGASLAGTTPNIDRLADAGMRFELAHVQVANCMPSRNVMWSGMYPHANGVEGFYPLAKPGYPTLGEILSAAGYYTAILGKVDHSTPYSPYPWDAVLDEVPAIADRPRYHKDPAVYGLGTAMAIEAAAQARRPFAVMINVSDPHVPFYGYDRRGRPAPDPYTPSRVFTADEVPVPGFLPEDPVIREEVSRYYSSVRRADDAVGAVLDALGESGAAGDTLVLFLSDHGIALPFGKTQLYHHSTRTPLILRWPNVIRAGAVDRAHMVSAVDLLPTLLQALEMPVPATVQGRSFLPLLEGGAQAGRDSVFKTYNQNGAGGRKPMRAVQTARYLYIFNPWADGSRSMHSATLGTNTFARMEELAKSDEAVAARLELLLHRVPEEFYDLQSDPDCLHNLVDEPAVAPQVQRLRSLMDGYLRDTGDPALAAWEVRGDPGALAAYMAQQDALAAQQRKAAREARKAAWEKALREREAAQGATGGGGDAGA